MLETYQSIANFGLLIVISAMYIYQTPKMIEKITRVVEANTNAIGDSKMYHQRLEEFIMDMRSDIDDIKATQNDAEIKAILQRIEKKVDDMGK